MKVCLVVPTLRGGGAERIATILANGWADRGYRVAIITLDEPTPQDYALSDRVERLSLGLLGHSPHWLAGLMANARRLLALRRALLRLRPDVALGIMTEAAVLTACAVSGTPIRMIACEHIHPPMASLSAVWRWLRQRAYPRASRVVMLTEDGAQWLRDHIPKARAAVIPNPVEFPLLAQRGALDPATLLSPDQPLVLGVGRLSAQKHFDLAIAAFARVAEAHPQARFVILGEGPERQDLEAQVVALNLSGRVLLPGWAGNLADWYRRASVLVLSSRFEGFPNVLLESMAHGCPVVSLDCPTGPRDIVTHGANGLLLPMSSGPAELADSLMQLLEDDQTRARLAAGALEVRDRYAIAEILSRWEQLFREIGLRGPPVQDAAVSGAPLRQAARQP